MNTSYDLDKIKFSIDRGTFDRAVSLYENGKIKDFYEEYGKFYAKVQGTKLYDVYVDSKFFDEGDCSCYVGQNNGLCKHIIAVAIYAIKDGKKLSDKDEEFIESPICSGIKGEMSEEEFKKEKEKITDAMRYIKSYTGPSRIWFSYQASLREGCVRLSKIVSELSVSQQTSDLLVNLLLRLDKKVSGAVDDSDGTVGGFMCELVDVLIEYAQIDSECIKSFKKICKIQTCFEWEPPLIKIVDEGSDLSLIHI